MFPAILNIMMSQRGKGGVCVWGGGGLQLLVLGVLWMGKSVSLRPKGSAIHAQGSRNFTNGSVIKCRREGGGVPDAGGAGV